SHRSGQKRITISAAQEITSESVHPLDGITRGRPGLQPAAERLAIGVQLARHVADRGAGCMHAGGFFVTGLPPRPSRLLALLGR
ncbi:hypothetical protein, partial [Teichococcus wenyumeiae]|uniref:hypothetical protein n=1 Tax=Teichococcus wenyumeiae TaxID=2478470 RepID=UPI001F37021D